MKIQLLPDMFHRINSPVLSKRLEQQSPLKDMLNRIASGLEEKSPNQVLSNNEQQNKVRKLQFDTYTQTDTLGDIQGLDDEMLFNLVSVMKLGSHYINGDLEKLNEFKQNLARFDTTISQYEDMLNGKEELAQGFTMESIREILAKEKENRQTYIADNGGKLKDNNWGNSIKEIARFGNVFSENMDSQMDNLDLQFHPESSDIYKEIDRVFGQLEKAAGGFSDALKRLYEAVNRRGIHDARYQMHNRYIDTMWFNYYKEGTKL